MGVCHPFCPLFIDTMLNNNGPNIGDGLNFVTCEQTFKKDVYVLVQREYNCNLPFVVVDDHILSSLHLKLIEASLSLRS